jgi:hypothetical protein
MEAEVVDRPNYRAWYEIEDRTEPPEPEEYASCGSCEHFDIAPNWHKKPFQGPADGVCLAAWTKGQLEWVTEDETACQDWEEA